MNNPSSPLDTLRQLKEMLDAGALTPTEFEALKQRLVFSESAGASAPPTAPVAPVPPVADQPVAPSEPEPFAPASVAPLPPTFTELRSASLGQEPLSPIPPAAPVGAVPPAAPIFNEPLSPPPVVPPAPFPPPSAYPPPPAYTPPPAPTMAPDEHAGWVADEFPESERPAARSPLALILSIGGLLALLSLVVYLSLNRPPSERLSSTSLTAADSVAAPIETGPQAEQPTPAAVAAPETIRVVPSNPAPPLPARAAPPARDSVAAPEPVPAAADTLSP